MSTFVNDANKSIVCGAPPIFRDFGNYLLPVSVDREC